MLTALGRRPGAGQALLGRALGLDKTTMSRNLRLMERNGWIELASTDDGRERCYRLTPRGEKVFSAAKPGWMRGQVKLRAALRKGEWETSLKASGRVAEAAIAARRDFSAE